MGSQHGLRRVFATQEAIVADEERAVAALRADCSPVAALANRHRARASGVLRSVVLRPREGVPTVEAELYDGSGALDLIWLGRRRIAGIEPGRRALVEGLVCEVNGRRAMFNPRYQLVPRPGE